MKKSFTLIEVAVVVAILMILTSMVVGGICDTRSEREANNAEFTVAVTVTSIAKVSPTEWKVITDKAPKLTVADQYIAGQLERRVIDGKRVVIKYRAYTITSIINGEVEAVK